MGLFYIMVVISRKSAKENQQKYYFTGKPCKNGHVCQRITVTCACIECARNNNTQYRLADPTRARENYKRSARREYIKDPQKCSEGSIKWRKNKRDDYLASIRRVYESQKNSRPKVRMLQNAHARAKKFGLPFDLTPDDIHIPDTCPVLGYPLDRSCRDRTPSLDRIIPEKGYVRGNVIVISCRANVIKNNATVDEIYAVAEFFDKVIGEMK